MPVSICPAGSVVPVAQVEGAQPGARLCSPVPPATQRVTLRSRRAGQRQAGAGQAARPRRVGRVPGAGGPPPHPQPGLVRGLQRRLLHHLGDTHQPAPTSRARRRIDLPLGKVYVEVSKGFEIRPVRKVVEVTPDTRGDRDRDREGAALARAGLGHRRHPRPLSLADVGAAGRRGGGRERGQPAGQPVGRADDQRGRFRRPAPPGARGKRAATANTWCAWAPRTGSTCWGTSRCWATAAGSSRR